jgi:hypothetical protein
MKRFLLATIALGLAVSGFSQTDTTATERVDTIRVGGMIIIKKGDGRDTTRDRHITINTRKKKKPTNISTNWFIIDLGFSNLDDKTNYASAETQAFAPGSDEDLFKLRNGKSTNVNIWIFMQKLNMVKHVVNLKYGLGLELNNYRFSDERIKFDRNPTMITRDESWRGIDKNKLAADYLTVPLMLNFNFTPQKKQGFGFSAGVSGGYLYSARQKTKDGGKKVKTKDDFDLDQWKLSYIGELNMGPLKLYGSYATKSMWEKGLDQTPYNVGIRFGHW